jgi:hypothetical protein
MSSSRAFEAEAETHLTPQLRDNAGRFLAVCRAHSRAYTFHHAALVKRFLEGPARSVPPARVASLSAGGPPLAEVAGLLEQLRALRADTAPLERLRSLTE